MKIKVRQNAPLIFFLQVIECKQKKVVSQINLTV